MRSGQFIFTFSGVNVSCEPVGDEAAAQYAPPEGPARELYCCPTCGLTVEIVRLGSGHIRCCGQDLVPAATGPNGSQPGYGCGLEVVTSHLYP